METKRVSMAFGVMAIAVVGFCPGARGAENAHRAEDLLPTGALGVVAVRDVSATIEKARTLGVVRILEELEVPALLKPRIDKARMRIGEVLANFGLGIEDVVKAFRGSAFCALLDVEGNPPSIPELIFFTELVPEAEERITAALELVRTFMQNQGAGVQDYVYEGATVTAINVPDAPIEICSTMVHGGVAITVGRSAMEDFLSRGASAVAEDAFSTLPSVEALSERLGEGGDLVAFCDLKALFAKFGDRMAGDDRRKFEASGLARASVGYGLRISEPLGRVRPGGVKEVLVVAAQELDGAVKLLDLPALSVAEVSDMARDLVGIRAAFDAGVFLERLEGVVHAMGGEDAARAIPAAIEVMCARFGMDREELLTAVSGRLSVGAAQVRGRILPDVTLTFNSDRPDGLASLLEIGLPAVAAGRGKSMEFEGRTIYAADPKARDVPALVSPCVALDGVVLRGALSTQALKRSIRNGDDELDVIESKGVAGAVMELSPGPSIVVAVDLPRIASIVFEIASIVPEKHGRRMRRIVDRLPPVEDFFDEVCGMAVALYSAKDTVALESFSPVGQLPTFVGLAIVGSREEAASRPPAEEADRVAPWDQPPVF